MFRAKIKNLKFETKNCDIGNQHLKFSEMQKIVQNKKKKTNKQTNEKIKFRTKNAFLYILGCRFEKVLPYLKSVSSNLSLCQN